MSWRIRRGFVSNELRAHKSILEHTLFHLEKFGKQIIFDTLFEKFDVL